MTIEGIDYWDKLNKKPLDFNIRKEILKAIGLDQIAVKKLYKRNSEALPKPIKKRINHLNDEEWHWSLFWKKFDITERLFLLKDIFNMKDSDYIHRFESWYYLPKRIKKKFSEDIKISQLIQDLAKKGELRDKAMSMKVISSSSLRNIHIVKKEDKEDIDWDYFITCIRDTIEIIEARIKSAKKVSDLKLPYEQYKSIFEDDDYKGTLNYLLEDIKKKYMQLGGKNFKSFQNRCSKNVALITNIINAITSQEEMDYERRRLISTILLMLLNETERHQVFILQYLIARLELEKNKGTKTLLQEIIDDPKLIYNNKHFAIEQIAIELHKWDMQDLRDLNYHYK